MRIRYRRQYQSILAWKHKKEAREAWEALRVEKKLAKAIAAKLRLLQAWESFQ